MNTVVARARLVFSLVVLGATVVDLGPRLLQGAAALPAYERLLLGLLVAHLGYALVALLSLAGGASGGVSRRRVIPALDVLFAAAVGAATEGPGELLSPYPFPFFTFAVVSAGVQWGPRHAIMTAVASAALWLGIVELGPAERAPHSVIRPAGLIVVGYLVGHLGARRLRLEAELHARDAAEARTRIARDLHDTAAQVLAGVNLQLASYRELLGRGTEVDVLARLGELEHVVNQEHDKLRRYARSLVGLQGTPAMTNEEPATRFTLDLKLSGSGSVVEHVLWIIREGVTNVCRHARARTATLEARSAVGTVVIMLDDDGVGFASERVQPWSMASRVRELGGTLAVVGGPRPGAHLRIVVPQD